ncbi:hypothetical protein A2U01_0051347, partial [Trifolium medium]|nr:hypothetical protein [Trifolium medium]
MKMLWWKPVELPKFLRVVGCMKKNQTEKLVSLAMVVGSKWRLVARS